MTKRDRRVIIEESVNIYLEYYSKMEKAATSAEQLGSPADLYNFATQLLLSSRANMVDYRRRGRSPLQLLTITNAITNSNLQVENAQLSIEKPIIHVANDRELQERLLMSGRLPVKVSTRSHSFQIVYLIDEERFSCRVMKLTGAKFKNKGHILIQEAAPEELKLCARILFDIGRV